MNSDQPLVTVLFPVYNAEKYLSEALESILGQTYQNIEVLAIDDGSTDSSAAILEAVKDERLKTETNPKNLGLIGTLNRGIPLCKGKYIIRSDADDICLPERVEKQVAFMEANPDVGISGTGFGTFGPGKPLTKNGHFSSDHLEIRFRHLYQIHLMHGTSIWRTSFFLENEIVFDSDYAHAEDYELFDRSEQLTRLSNINEVLYLIRLHGENVSNQFNDTQRLNSIRVKKRGFLRLGLTVDEEQLDLFRYLCHHDHEKLQGKERLVADLLVRMLETNGQSNYFPSQFLKEKLVKLWTGLVLNNVASSRTEISKLLKEHAIAKVLTLKIKDRIKFSVKKMKA